MKRRVMSWRRITSAPPSSRSVKRVNSKQDLHDSPTSSSALTLEEIDSILKDNHKGIRTKAMTALKAAHCGETLACLYALFHLEDSDIDYDEEIPQNILKRFVERGAECELALPESLFRKLTDGGETPLEESLEELKYFVLTDLRFNPVLFRVLREEGNA